MSDGIFFGGKEYISSRRASGLSGYAQDYIGQLARKGLIEAQRVGGLWYVSLNSLTEYKSNTDGHISELPERKGSRNIDSLIAFDGKDHISAGRAAEITGYHRDYVGQLARSGAIISRQVGNRWYIDREGILAHKQEKDSLLGAVQSQSVGLVRRPMAEGINADLSREDRPEGSYNGAGPFMTYTSDTRDLLPVLPSSESMPIQKKVSADESGRRYPEEPNPVAIRVLQRGEILHHDNAVKHVKSRGRIHGKTRYYGTFGKVATAALTIVIVLSFGFATLKNSSIYGTSITPTGSVIQRNIFTASAAEALQWVGHLLENLFVSELVYKRGQ